jgi:serine/threonine protein kinase
MIADQCLARIEFIHRRFFLHREITPTNMLLGTARKRSVLYFIDFGLSKFYRDCDTLAHIPPGRYPKFVGTARYVSANVMNGIEPSRRDDVISLGYVWVYLFKGALPWQSLELAEGENTLRVICERKHSINPDQLCSGMPLSSFDTLKSYILWNSIRNRSMQNSAVFSGIASLDLISYMTDNGIGWHRPARMSFGDRPDSL